MLAREKAENTPTSTVISRGAPHSRRSNPVRRPPSEETMTDDRLTPIDDDRRATRRLAETGFHYDDPTDCPTALAEIGDRTTTSCRDAFSGCAPGLPYAPDVTGVVSGISHRTDACGRPDLARNLARGQSAPPRVAAWHPDVPVPVQRTAKTARTPAGRDESTDTWSPCTTTAPAATSSASSAGRLRGPCPHRHTPSCRCTARPWPCDALVEAGRFSTLDAL